MLSSCGYKGFVQLYSLYLNFSYTTLTVKRKKRKINIHDERRSFLSLLTWKETTITYGALLFVRFSSQHYLAVRWTRGHGNGRTFGRVRENHQLLNLTFPAISEASDALPLRILMTDMLASFSPSASSQQGVNFLPRIHVLQLNLISYTMGTWTMKT